jgi:NRPS condensation-like uncharacterized protein
MSVILPLTPVDYFFTGTGAHPLTFAFSYKENLDPAVLRRCLDETLKHFPILSSKLRRTSEHDYVFQMKDDGLSFETFKSSFSFDELKDVRQIITPVRSKEEEPLTKIKLMQTPKGSVLAVSISHALVDGFSYFHFLSSWASICKGQRILKPSLQREQLLPGITDHKKPITFDSILAHCGLFYEQKRHELGTDPIREERIFISREIIRSHLEEAKQKYEISFSENDIITALLWKKYIPLWSDGKHNPTTYVTCPFDFRRTLRELSKTYLGCALCFATASIDFEGLVKASLGDLALLVRNAVGKINRDYILGSLQALETLRRKNGLGAMEKLHLRHPQHGIVVTNITRLPIRDLDFGIGAPVSFLTYTEILRGAAIFPEENGVEILVLHPPNS